MNLRYCYMTAMLKCNETRHAQEVMHDIGISYQYSTPQSLGDQYFFWNCENIPDKLPEYLSELDLDPMECIGYGLSKDIAKSIHDYMITKQ